MTKTYHAQHTILAQIRQFRILVLLLGLVRMRCGSQRSTGEGHGARTAGWWLSAVTGVTLFSLCLALIGMLSDDVLLQTAMLVSVAAAFAALLVFSDGEAESQQQNLPLAHLPIWPLAWILSSASLVAGVAASLALILSGAPSLVIVYRYGVPLGLFAVGAAVTGSVVTCSALVGATWRLQGHRAAQRFVTGAVTAYLAVLSVAMMMLVSVSGLYRSSEEMEQIRQVLGWQPTISLVDLSAHADRWPVWFAICIASSLSAMVIALVWGPSISARPWPYPGTRLPRDSSQRDWTMQTWAMRAPSPGKRAVRILLLRHLTRDTWCRQRLIAFLGISALTVVVGALISGSAASVVLSVCAIAYSTEPVLTTGTTLRQLFCQSQSHGGRWVIEVSGVDPSAMGKQIDALVLKAAGAVAVVTWSVQSLVLGDYGGALWRVVIASGLGAGLLSYDRRTMPQSPFSVSPRKLQTRTLPAVASCVAVELLWRQLLHR